MNQKCKHTKTIHISRNEKLLYPSFDIPITNCRKTCEYAISNLCYAKNNPRYMIFNDKKLRLNEKLLNSKRLVSVIKREILLTNTRKFRWFSCGDMYKMDHLDKIEQIALDMPFISFWLSTHTDHLLFEKYANSKPPNNLNIILSNKIPNTDPPKFLVKWLNSKGMAISSTTNDVKKSNCHTSYDKTSCDLCEKCFTGENIVYYIHGKYAEKRLEKYQNIQVKGLL